MSEIKRSNSRNIIISLLIWVIVNILLYQLVVIESTEHFEDSLVPIFGLPFRVHNFFLLYIWMTVFAMISILIFSRLLTPFFLKIKKMIWRKYEDAFVEVQVDPFNFKKFLKRATFVFLFTLGLSATLSVFNLVNPSVFVSNELAADIESQNIRLIYSMDGYFGIIMFLFPISIGAWSIGWSLEDAGLIHFNLPKGDSKLFDIEPIHLRYTNIIKGYAGFSAIMYYISAIVYYMTNHPDRLLNIIMLLIFGLLIIVLMIPSYLVYWKLNKRFLIKGLKEIERITELNYKN